MANCGTITVVAQAPNISVTGCSLQASEVAPGGEFSMDVTLRNSGNAGGTATVDILANGQRYSSEKFEVAAGDTITGTVPLSAPSDEGDYVMSAQVGNVETFVGLAPFESRTTRASNLRADGCGCGPSREPNDRQRDR